MAAFQSTFQSFIADCLVQSSGSTIARTTIRATYVAWNKNSTEGINKLYNAFRDLPNTIDTKNVYGFALKPQAESQPIVKPTPAPIEQVIIPTINEQLLAIKQAKLEQAEKTRITQAAIEQEKLEIKRQKMEQAAVEAEKARALEQQKMEQAAVEAEKARALKREKMAQIERMEYVKMNHITAENDKRIAHQSIENNMNRRLFQEIACPHFDLRSYGTPSVQYGSTESVQRVILNNIATHDVFDGLKTNDQLTQTKAIRQIEDVIREKVSACSEMIVIANDRSKSEINAIDFEQMNDLAMEIIEECRKLKVISSSSPWLETFNHKLTTTKSIAKTDSFQKTFPTHKEYLIQTIPSRKTKLDKSKYIKPRNMASIDTNGRTMISCYTCNQRMYLDDKSVQCCHNIPDSNLGSWHPDNIYLCCANCNMSMGSDHTVEEHSVNMRFQQLSDTESDSGSDSFCE